MKKISLLLAIAGLSPVFQSSGVSLDDIQFWIGSGTNRAALVIEWSAPESMFGSTVPAPVADKSLVWGYRFNGTATGEQMFTAIVAADPRLYAVISIDPLYGLGIYGIGFHLGGGGDLGITDGTHTNYFTGGLLTNATVNVDAAAPLNAGDVYWGGWFGPNWEAWAELGAGGGLLDSPDRGSNAYWTPDDPNSPDSLGAHGQWNFTWGVGSLQLTNGSWIGLSVAAGEFEYDTVSPFFTHKHAPTEPDAGITALVKNLNGSIQGSQWNAQFLGCTNWLYSLERSTNLQNWTAVTNGVPGNSTSVNLIDPTPPEGQAFYRIRADKP